MMRSRRWIPIDPVASTHVEQYVLLEKYRYLVLKHDCSSNVVNFTIDVDIDYEVIMEMTQFSMHVN